MKYVMINDSFPITFTDNFDHCAFRNLGKITSAGFVDIGDREIRVYGNSHTLKLSPAFDDHWILKRFLMPTEEKKGGNRK